MKERELREHTDCDSCQKPIGASGLPCFFTVHLRRHGIRLERVGRQSAFAGVMGGNAHLAMVMGPDEELTETLLDVRLTVCETCAMDGGALLHRMAQVATERDERKKSAA